MSKYISANTLSDIRYIIKNGLLHMGIKISSSHIAEALASTLGYKTNASLISHISHNQAIDISDYNIRLFSERIRELCHQDHKPDHALIVNLALTVYSNNNLSNYNWLNTDIMDSHDLTLKVINHIFDEDAQKQYMSILQSFQFYLMVAMIEKKHGAFISGNSLNDLTEEKDNVITRIRHNDIINHIQKDSIISKQFNAFCADDKRPEITGILFTRFIKNIGMYFLQDDLSSGRMQHIFCRKVAKKIGDYISQKDLLTKSYEPSIVINGYHDRQHPYITIDFDNHYIHKMTTLLNEMYVSFMKTDSLNKKLDAFIQKDGLSSDIIIRLQKNDLKDWFTIKVNSAIQHDIAELKEKLPVFCHFVEKPTVL